MVFVATTTITDREHRFMYEADGQAFEQVREIEVRLFAPDEPGRYPVVIYSHGQFGQPSGAAAVHPTALAEAGYIVVVPTHLDSADVPRQIRDDFPFEPETTLHRIADIQFLLDEIGTLSAELLGYIADASAPVIAGHSHGARTAMLLAGATSELGELTGLAPDNIYGLESVADPRFAAAILLSPAGPENGDGSGFTELSWQEFGLPSLWITGTQDETVLQSDYHARLFGFDAAPEGQKHAVVVAGADHLAVGGRDAAPEMSAAIANAATAFLDGYLKGDAAALARLSDSGGYLAEDPALSHVFAARDSDGDGGGGSGEGTIRVADEAEIRGLATDDTLLVAASAARTTIEPVEGGFLLAPEAGDAVTIRSVEALVFEDARLVLDVSDDAALIALLYETVYDRAGEPAGLAFWTGALRGGTELGAIADAFADSPEFDALYGEAVTNEAYVAALYENALGRPADPEGAAFWRAVLDGRMADRGDMLAFFAMSPEIATLFENELDDGVWLLG